MEILLADPDFCASFGELPSDEAAAIFTQKYQAFKSSYAQAVRDGHSCNDSFIDAMDWEAHRMAEERDLYAPLFSLAVAAWRRVTPGEELPKAGNFPWPPDATGDPRHPL
jgi:hypothetical protein